MTHPVEYECLQCEWQGFDLNGSVCPRCGGNIQPTDYNPAITGTIFEQMIEVGKRASVAKRELRDDKPRDLDEELPALPTELLGINSYPYFNGFTDLMAKHSSRVEYYLYGLISEVGELVELLTVKEMTPSEIKGELGDILWYTSRLCVAFGFVFADVMLHNLTKLYSRFERKVIQGEGDNR